MRKDSVTCQLAESFFQFWPSFQRFAESKTPGRSLSPQRARILAALRETSPRTMGDLKRELGVTATNVTALIDALEKDGLVVRKPHPEDRRATLLELATGAECETAKRCGAFRESVGELFDVLTEGDRKELLRLIEKLRANLANAKGCSR